MENHGIANHYQGIYSQSGSYGRFLRCFLQSIYEQVHKAGLNGSTYSALGLWRNELIPLSIETLGLSTMLGIPKRLVSL